MTKEMQLYGSFDIEAAEEEAKQSKQGSGNIIRKLEEGIHKFRFLPPRVGETSPFLVTFEHFFNVGPNKSVSFNCPREMARQQCPVCMEVARYEASGTPADKALADDRRARRYVWAVVLDRSDASMVPKMFRFGKTIHEKLLGIRTKHKINFVDPMTGIDIVIERTGKGKNDTEYTVMMDPDGKSPLAESEEQMIDVLTAAPNMHETVGRVLSLEAINAKLSGEESQIGVRDAKAKQLPSGKTARDYTTR